MQSSIVKLKEIIHSKMDILFLALNAPEKSNSKGHWFSNNLSFWNIIYDAGLITERILDPCEGDEKLFKDNKINYNSSIFGVTDLNRRDVETCSRKVIINDRDVDRILYILNLNDINVLCIVHSKVAKKFERKKLITRLPVQDRIREYGIVGRYNTVSIYEMPFHNSNFPNKEKEYKKLKVEL